MAKGLLDPGSLRHFDAQPFVGFLTPPRALDHKLLQVLGRLLTCVEQSQISYCRWRARSADWIAHQRHRLNRPFKERKQCGAVRPFSGAKLGRQVALGGL